MRFPALPRRGFSSARICSTCSQGLGLLAGSATPTDSDSGFARPVLLVQGNVFNRSRISTLVVLLTSNLRCASYLRGGSKLNASRAGIVRLFVLHALDVHAERAALTGFTSLGLTTRATYWLCISRYKSMGRRTATSRPR